MARGIHSAGNISTSLLSCPNNIVRRHWPILPRHIAYILLFYPWPSCFLRIPPSFMLSRL
nr:MAG TPA: hypothetical protein [Bacteriophage sp.]